MNILSNPEVLLSHFKSDGSKELVGLLEQLKTSLAVQICYVIADALLIEQQKQPDELVMIPFEINAKIDLKYPTVSNNYFSFDPVTNHPMANLYFKELSYCEEGVPYLPSPQSPFPCLIGYEGKGEFNKKINLTDIYFAQVPTEFKATENIISQFYSSELELYAIPAIIHYAEYRIAKDQQTAEQIDFCVKFAINAIGVASLNFELNALAGAIAKKAATRIITAGFWTAVEITNLGVINSNLSAEDKEKIMACYSVLQIFRLGTNLLLTMPALNAKIQQFIGNCKNIPKDSPIKALANKAMREHRLISCFTAGTLIATEQGLKPIEQLMSGEKVWSRDLPNNTNSLQTVGKVFSKQTNKLKYLFTGEEIICTTPEHPFYDGNDWQMAKYLIKGSKVQDFLGNMRMIDSTYTKDSLCMVYNFEVTNTHNYFVGKEKLLVHNFKIACDPKKTTVLVKTLGKGVNLKNTGTIAAHNVADVIPVAKTYIGPMYKSTGTNVGNGKVNIGNGFIKHEVGNPYTIEEVVSMDGLRRIHISDINKNRITFHYRPNLATGWDSNSAVKQAIETLNTFKEAYDNKVEEDFSDDKGKDDDDSNAHCTYCGKTVQNQGDTRLEYLLCVDVHTLEQVAGTPLPPELCALKPPTKPAAHLHAIVLELLKYDKPTILAFYNDIKSLPSCSSDYLCGNILTGLNVDIVKAWKIVYDTKNAVSENYRKDYKLLDEIVHLRSNTVALQQIGGEIGLKTIIEKNKYPPCNTCSNPPSSLVLVFFDKYINDVNYFASNFNTKPGFSIVTGPKGMKCNGAHQVNATAFIIRALHENETSTGNTYINSISGFEERIETINEDGQTNAAEADIIENANKIIECKSWALNGISFQKFVEGTSGSVQQFKTYLSDPIKVTSMNNIEYWFDGKKGVTETQVKQKFRDMLCNNCNQPNVTQKTLSLQGGAIFEAIWGNQSLRESLFPETVGKDQNWLNNNKNRISGEFSNLISDINDINDPFYKFIKVK